MQTKKRLFSIVLVVAVLLTLSGVIARLTPSNVLGAEEVSTPLEPNVAATALPMMVDNPYMIADIVEVTSPATVFISVEWPMPERNTERNTVPQDPFSFFFDFWFNEPFGGRQPTQPKSAGSGFIIDETGIILTNQHVVGNLWENQKIKVTVEAPGLEREYEAELIGADANLDLAVLRIINENNQVFPYVRLGDSDSSRIGEWLIAIGNPYGQAFEHTVTVGVLSAKGREISIMNSDTGKPQVYKNLMQTDAAINRGNSGGPLLNIKGEVVGINTAVHAQAQGIGFAIPINVAKEVLEELITTGGVALEPRSYLGIHQQNLNPSLVKQLNLPDEKGVLILDVIQGSPAQLAGLKAWDVIRRIDDRDIFDSADVVEAMAQHQPGDEVLVTIYRQGEMLLIPVTIGDMPPHVRQMLDS